MLGGRFSKALWKLSFRGECNTDPGRQGNHPPYLLPVTHSDRQLCKGLHCAHRSALWSCVLRSCWVASPHQFPRWETLWLDWSHTLQELGSKLNCWAKKYRHTTTLENSVQSCTLETDILSLSKSNSQFFLQVCHRLLGLHLSVSWSHNLIL